eukprot:scaffold81975_cov18-Tisochrysis_lutea.AAC.1
MQGNPCIEEPDYRMIVIYNIPSLQILDLHMVTDTERQKARMLIGGETEVWHAGCARVAAAAA